MLVASSAQKLPGVASATPRRAGNHCIPLVAASGHKSGGALPGIHRGQDVAGKEAGTGFAVRPHLDVKGVGYCPEAL